MDKYLKMADVFDLPLNADMYRVDFPIISDGKDAIIGGFGINGASELAAHAINSHDELVENMQHYKQDVEQWEARAVKEASRANDLQAEVERLRGALQDAYLDGCHAGWDMSGEGCNAEYGAPEDGAMHDIFVLKSMEYMK